MIIEIVFDKHNNNTFLDKERPVFVIEDFSGNSFKDYKNKAQELINQLKDEPIVIVKNQAPNFNINIFSVALFVELYHLDTKLGCIVFQTNDIEQARTEYYPYMSLTIGLKYIIRLREETPKIIFKEIALLSYLNFSIKEDFLQNKIFINKENNNPQIELFAQNTDEALVNIGLIKALSLAPIPISFKAEFNISSQPVAIDENTMIEQTIEAFFKFLK